MNTKQLSGHPAAIFTVFIWGTTFISTKILLRSLSPVEILFIRFLLGYGTLWLLFPRKLKLVNRSQNFFFLMAGICGITLYYMFENIALTYSQASNICVIVSIAPFFTVLFDCMFLEGNRPGPCYWAGFALALSGICFISFPAGTLSFHPAGDLLALGAAVIWAAYSTLTKKISTFGYNTIQITRRTFFYGILCMIPFLFFMDFHPDLLTVTTHINLFNLLFLGILASAVCFVTWNLAVKNIGPVKTSTYIYLTPVITTIASFLILKEQITPSTILGIVLTLLGLALSEYKKKNNRES